MTGNVLNLGHLYFDIVSNFVLRISDFSYRDTLHASRDTNLPSTPVERALQIEPFLCKTNPILERPSKCNLLVNNELRTINYELWNTKRTQNESNLSCRSLWRSRNKPNFKTALRPDLPVPPVREPALLPCTARLYSWILPKWHNIWTIIISKKMIGKNLTSCISRS